MRLVGVLLLALCVGVGLAAGDAAAKKKKKPKASVFAASVAPNAAIPDEPPTGPDIPVVSTLTVGKKFKGKTIGDVNVTGIQTTGSDADSAGDLNFNLTAPNGATVLLDDRGLGGQSIGPLTLDDDTRTSICDATTTASCPDPDSTLTRPFAGTANMWDLFSGDLSPLSILNGGPMKGTWTFRIWDNNQNTETSTLNTWGLQVTAARPVK
jgi:subtilisin-like proprotein convertase family protein